MKQNLFYPLLLLFPLLSKAQQTDSLKAFTLGEVVVTGRTFDSVNTISIKQVERYNRLDVSSALNIMSGVTLSNVGARNESMVFVRGFDLRQVPVFIDGVPVYVPYDGYVDLARFTTFDLAEINVAKGFSSALYGANTLGGAINLVSRKPTSKFEFNGASGFLNGGYRSSINAGARLNKFYLQAGASKLKRDYYMLSHHFDSVKNENGGRRDNSYRDDIKYSIKIGFTPTQNQDYAISYINQKGVKGTPVYAGADLKNSLLAKPRYWQWPAWNKQSLYFISNTTLNKNSYVKLRAFYDTFYNELFSYDDVNYTTISKPYAFKSFYDDYTYGGSIEYGTKAIAKNDLRISAIYKRDIHREHNEGEPVRRTEDITASAGIENNFSVTDKLNITPGLTYSMRKSEEAQSYDGKEITEFPANTNTAFNAQLGVLYKVSPTGVVTASVARKTRFATIKDRYSYRMGTALPNPDLHAESSLNYELAYNTVSLEKLRLQTNLFYSNVSDVIQSVNNVQPGLSQLQNTGKAKFYGAEASLQYTLTEHFTMGVNYTYIKRKNNSNTDIKFTDVPNHKLFGSVQFSPFKNKNSYILTSIEHNSSRYSTSYGTATSGYTLVNIKESLPIWKYFAVEAGINNIFDKNYALTEGYPEEGRNYFVTLAYRGAFN